MLEIMLGGSPPVSATGPGPSTLIGSYQDPNVVTRFTGYYGEVASTAFINATDLSTLCGMGSSGELTPDAHTCPWMKFLLDGKILFVSKRPLRTNTQVYQLQSTGVYNGKLIVINGQTYKVRLLSALRTSPSAYTAILDAPITHYSEWNRLMYNVCGEVSPASQEGSKWANYSLVELGHDQYGSLTNQIITSGSTSYYATHDNGAANTFLVLNGQKANTALGPSQSWRPVLELVP